MLSQTTKLCSSAMIRTVTVKPKNFKFKLNYSFSTSTINRQTENEKAREELSTAVRGLAWYELGVFTNFQQVIIVQLYA